jgi:predicted kinase
MHINPDNYLQTPAGRVTTPERNKVAWDQCYEALEAAARQAGPSTRVYLLVGSQGSGKSTWARARSAEQSADIFFDAILVKRSERARVLEIVRPFELGTIAVWFQTPLQSCLARNALRPEDEVVSEQAIRNVFAALEPPSIEEGFEDVLIVP